MTNINLLIPLGASAIGALIALAGVVVGQLMQGRREFKLRESQWVREDRHRFTDQKRDLYADVLATVDKWQRNLREFQHHMIIGRSPSPKLWSHWVNAKSAGDIDRRQMDLLLGRVRLLSPQTAPSVLTHVEKLDMMTGYVALEQAPPEQISWPVIESSLDDLTVTLARDLANGE
ncbi:MULTISPECIES: hypothetical protein [unclassified Crossiella]|uniref:hypothetical protein n=1 Tax=unclassified Crossiella TaxID=2620835 RepID=UPI001FFED9D7|nr:MULTISPECIES: hypothetical protein [unclassified Crossiella]MCK2245385.1 hypothetical protein [Crossiella sp. S99.2]MCK2259028.1 hypothetical protein [Crossiella sp. S99.1]